MCITLANVLAPLQVLDAELFNTLRETHGASYLSFMLTKLIPVTGNICDSNIGLQADSAEEIANEVDVIINSAANTTFNERLAIIRLCASDSLVLLLSMHLDLLILFSSWRRLQI